MRTLTNPIRQAVAVGAILVAVVSLTGCDQRLATAAGYGYGYGYGGYTGGYGYYDPTSTIQDVIGYRSQVMDNSAMAWDQYITGDYYGGDNDDLSTPTYWASGAEWP